MKKILFLLLSLAVASSAIAGPVKHVQKSQIRPSAKGVELTKAPAVAYNLNAKVSDINAPKVQYVQKQKHDVVSGVSGLTRSVKPMTRAAVIDQPDGEVTYYRRSGNAIVNHGVYNSSGQLTAIDSAWVEQEGIMKVVVDGNNYWFNNLLYDPEGWYPETWVKGTKSGNTISITLPYAYDDVSYASYGVTIYLYWCNTRIQNGTLRWTRQSTTTAYFDIADDGTMTLRNATSSAPWTGNGLSAGYRTSNYSTTYYFDNAAIFNTTLTPMGDIPEAPEIYTDSDIDAMDGNFVEYYRTGYCWKRMYDETGTYLGVGIDEQTGYAYMFYDADGETVYMRDPVYGAAIFSDVVGHWIKGTKDGNTLTFPVNQYIMWDDEFYGVKVNYGLLVEDTTTNYLTYTPLDEVTEFTYTIDDAAGTITLNDCGYIDDDMTQFVGIGAQLDSAYLDPGWLGALDFYTVYYEIPAIPTEVTVQEGSTTANVSWTPGVANDKWNARYREYVDPASLDFYFNEFETDADLEYLWGIDNDGDGYWWGIMELDDGNHAAKSNSWNSTAGALNPDNWLITPKITLNGVVSVDAWGWEAAYSSEVYGVYIFVGDTATIEDPNSDFIQLGSDVTTTADMTTSIFAIPEEYWGMEGYVAIVHHNISDQNILCVDNLYVGNPDAIPEWNYVYDIEDPATVLQGLTPETTYEVQVQGANDGGVGSWTESVVFTTLADQPQPVVKRGDVDGDGVVGMGDLTALINYLVGIFGPDDINFENAAVCDSMTGDASEVVGMEDLTALINYLVYGTWPN